MKNDDGCGGRRMLKDVGDEKFYRYREMRNGSEG
jgi:hypothetical protein